MLNKRFWKGAAMVSLEMLVAMTVFTAALVGLILLIKPWVRELETVDLVILQWISGRTSDGMNGFMRTITYLGQHPVLIPANLSLIAYFLFVRRHSWFSIRIAAIAITSLIFMFTLKNIFMRQRPEEPLLYEASGYSFPSGHAIMSVTFYGLLIYITAKTVTNKFLHAFITGLLVLLIITIGFSRVYLRVHYASDVIVGFITGLAWLLISLYMLKRIEEFNKVVPVVKREEPVN